MRVIPACGAASAAAAAASVFAAFYHENNGADKRSGDDRQNYIIIYIHLPIPKGGKGSCNAMARLIHFHAYYITLYV